MKHCAKYLLFFFAFFCFQVSCKKNKIITSSSAKLIISSDSILFDTVFTTIGSSTKYLIVKNPNKGILNISEIKLKNGHASPFILNVDGSPGKYHTNIEIPANDSIFIMVQVNVNPTNQNSPLIISDELEFHYNGNKQTVYLEAWGQDAYYHKPDKAIYFSNGSYLPYSLISSSENTTVVWPNDKPHVIYGWVVVDSTQKLIIQPGTKIYLNYKAGIWVYRYGEIKVNGTLGNEVIFTSARREKDYLDEPGQWDRIWINEGSTGNEINYAIIKNGFIGIQAELLGNSFNVPKRLKITNTKIQNMSLWGMYFLGFNVWGGNNVVINCREYCLNILSGGKYTFYHSTFANFWNKSVREKSCIHINNYNTQQTLPLDSCYFGSCIIDGNRNEEITLDLSTSTPSLLPKYFFSNCVLRTQINTINPQHFEFNKINVHVDFKDISNYNAELGSNSQAGMFSQGNATLHANYFPNDIKGQLRLAPFWAGAYVK
ncbi:MAG: hypothetical protein N3F09_06210 [Bacteroidia bacterium]|nr:hypothetical protein [Bacteroidia bacterium]